MALSKSIAGPTGASATYWVIARANVNVIQGMIRVTLQGYLDSNAFSGSDEAMDDRTYDLTGADYTSITTSASGILVAIYAWILANVAEFTSATQI